MQKQFNGRILGELRQQNDRLSNELVTLNVISEKV